MDTAQLTLVRPPFDHPDFLFELKHDRFRALAYISEGRCELVSLRSRVNVFMNKFRELGFIHYNGGLQVHSSLLNVVLHD